jgi:hypothetical protein
MTSAIMATGQRKPFSRKPVMDVIDLQTGAGTAAGAFR